MAIFTPHSPEQFPNHLTPEQRRDGQIIPLAVGYLSAACKEALDAPQLEAEQITYPNQMPERQTLAPAPVTGDVTALQEYYRKKAELAREVHGQFDYPAEDITPEVSEFRRKLTLTDQFIAANQADPTPRQAA